MKITTLVFDFSWVLIFPRDRFYAGAVNDLHDQLSNRPEYKFFDNFVLNEPLLDYLKKIKRTVSLNIFTAGHVQNLPEVRDKLDLVFEKIYSKSEVGIEKADSEAYKFIAKDLGKKPEEILFVDDTGKNVEAAKKAGLQTIQFESNDKLIKELNKLIK